MAPVEFVFVVDNTATATAFACAVAASAEGVAPVAIKPRGQIVAYARDLNGALVELCTSVAVAP